VETTGAEAEGLHVCDLFPEVVVETEIDIMGSRQQEVDQGADGVLLAKRREGRQGVPVEAGACVLGFEIEADAPTW